ncbi:MAG: AGE family epimerase/isomerase [Tannerellaceae bacterium]|jgi:mannobiose 2-epimerase|nr:AGE family epimerase/isomerase [Tannerellaceae bacterium]
MRNLFLITFLIIFSFAAGAQNSAKDNAAVEQLRKEIVDDLTMNILPYWAKHAPDPAGGFYGLVSADNKPDPAANKGGILNARIVWTFSTAYRILGDDVYRELADRGARYFLEHFIDREHGGVVWDLKADGTVANAQKQSYVNAFGIYGLSEHFRATGCIESLQGAVAIYRSMIEHVFDPVNGGFIENFSRDWKLPENLAFPKGMNNNLHVLEALTNLYRVWKDPGLKGHLRRQIDVMSNKILDQNTWHEKLYLSMDFVPRMRIDSYGHDIEFSWLLVEAAEVLGDEEIIADTRRIAVNIADVQLREGTAPEGYVRGEKFWDARPFGAPPRNPEAEKHGERLEWWPQAEAVVGYFNAWQISGEEKYLDAAARAWAWIKKCYIDREFGEWYGNVYADGTPDRKSQKASMWRCPYHNSRMGFEIMTRTSFR